MAVLYTPEDIQGVLKELRIKPIKGTVTTQEAARILTWRAKAEQEVDFTYHASAVRRHIQLGNLTPAEPVNIRFNRYKVGSIFDLPLAPKRGLRQASKQETDEAA